MTRDKYRTVNSRDAQGWTLLHWAAMKGDVPAIRWLLRQRAKVNVREQSGFTPLIIAASEGHAKAVKVLVAGGAHVNAKAHGNLDGTALHSACVWGKTEVVKALLASPKTKRNLKDDSGKTPLAYAKLYKHRRIVQLFEDGTT